MRVRQLEYFVAVCETGSITRAAAKLNVAQPALGMQIKALEDHLGARLLHRSRRGAQVTDAGELVFQEARHLLERVGELKRRLRDLNQTQAQTVMLGLPPSLAILLTGRLLTALSKGKSPVKLQIFEEFSHTLLGRIQQGRLDIALAYSVPPDEFPAREALLRERLYFVASPESAFGGSKEPIALGDLSGVPMVMPSERDYVRQIAEEAMGRNNKTLNIAYQVESMAAMKDLIRQGMAYSILPYANLIREIGDGSLCVRQIVDPPISRTLYLLRSDTGTLQKSGRAVISLLRYFLPELVEENPALSLLSESGIENSVSLT